MTLAFAALFCWLSVGSAFACTSAVISGKVTPDGRPLLWKNRDSDFLRNQIEYVTGEKYHFLAVVNSADFTRKHEAWMGTNSAGFALMNTQSYNLVKIKAGEERGEANGRVIFRALAICATVEDFCHYLDTIAKPSGIEANFGVIDAQGGAAMFEVDYDHYVMYDANNPKDAPYGYIARTNFSFAGEVNAGAGYVRYMEAERVFMQGSAMRSITPQFIFNELSRSFRNNILDIDLRSGDYNRPKASGWVVDKDFIPRRSTACSVVVQGVKQGENPELTTMWTLLGYPPTGVAVPLWIKEADRLLPRMVRWNETVKTSLLSASSLLQAEEVFSYRQGMGTGEYLNWERLWNAAGTGYMQVLAPLEEHIFTDACAMQKRWYAAGKVDRSELQQLYIRMEDALADYCSIPLQ
jgi:hypothetical protein